MNQKFSPKGVVFLAVYIVEAHAKDEWPCGKTLSFCNQPKTTKERCELAKQAQEECSFSFPFLVDPIQNIFQITYASWPFRYYCFVDGKLSFKPQPNTEHFAYLIDELNVWLEKVTN